MFEILKRAWQGGLAIAESSASVLVSQKSSDVCCLDETYDHFDTTPLPTNSQALVTNIPPRHLRSELAYRQAAMLLAPHAPEPPTRQGSRIPADGVAIPGSLLSAIKNALHASMRHDRYSLVAWADVVQRSRRMGVSRRDLVELRPHGGKTLFQLLAATRDHVAFIALAASLPKGTYSEGAIVVGRDYRGEAAGPHPHGFGVLHSSHYYYAGSIQMGKMHGSGKQHFAGKLRHQGRFIHGERCGSGAYLFPGGAKISGVFSQNLPEGPGVLHRSAGVKEDVFFTKRENMSFFTDKTGRHYQVALLPTTELSLCETTDRSTNSTKEILGLRQRVGW